jgi:hypothetical protein
MTDWLQWVKDRSGKDALPVKVVEAAAPIPVTGSLEVQFPPGQVVTVDNLDVALSSRFKPGDAIGPLPAGSAVIGKIAVDQTTPGTTNKVSIGTDGHVSVDNFPATQPISGNIEVNNFPATQPITGTVAVSNLPVTQEVSGVVGVVGIDVALSTIFKSGDAIAPLPAGSAVIGQVGIDQTTPGTTNKVSIGNDGSVIASAGTNLNTSALALESGGNIEKLKDKSGRLEDLIYLLLVEMRITNTLLSQGLNLKDNLDLYRQEYELRR